MIATLLLAAAAIAVPGPDVYTDDDGCRWLKQTAPAVAEPAAPRPFVVHHPKPRPAGAVRPKPKRKSYFKPVAPLGYDPIDCDEGGPPAPSALPPAETSIVEFTLVPEDLPPPEFIVRPEPMQIEPLWPDPEPAFGPPPASFVDLGSGPRVGPVLIVVPPRAAISRPVPEPSTWALLLLAGLGLAARRRLR